MLLIIWVFTVDAANAAGVPIVVRVVPAHAGSVASVAVPEVDADAGAAVLSAAAHSVHAAHATVAVLLRGGGGAAAPVAVAVDATPTAPGDASRFAAASCRRVDLLAGGVLGDKSACRVLHHSPALVYAPLPASRP